ncbi:uncharacterized protein [Malus domestica]|uniref:uncharacterized protein n=1 Tax=Malus domestica TaxID=3750 RepID=UPI0010AA13B8|nr:uncharacterized protein LOC103423969 isoform X2 [Malus domestica]
MENVAHIDKLQPYVKAAKIKVQICRIWKSTIPGTVQKYIALHCILLDEMIVLSSTTSSLFFLDPDIPELNAYKSVFSINTEAVKLLAPSSRQVNEAQILQTARRVTVDELAFFYPDLYKDETFLCRASIKRFDTRYNWWYSTCPNCVKQMQKDPYVRVGKKIIVK